jgi:dihydrofolate reductase
MGMTRTIYRTATSLDGYIADGDHSLDWLFAVQQAETDDHDAFLSSVGVIVEGSSTYEWVLRETDMLAKPEQWQQYYGSRPTFVFTSRALPSPAGADVRFRRGSVGDHVTEIVSAAGQSDVWVVGGGDLAGQFLDVDALDEIVLTVAPVSLAAGSPLLPRRIESDRLRLTAVHQRGQFADLTYSVTGIV